MLTEVIGFAGIFLVLVAYIPQVYHLIKEKCSAGISRKAFLIWLISSLLLLIRSFMGDDIIFTILQGINFSATATILITAQKFKDNVCGFHHEKLSSKEIG